MNAHNEPNKPSENDLVLVLSGLALKVHMLILGLIVLTKPQTIFNGIAETLKNISQILSQ